MSEYEMKKKRKALDAKRNLKNMPREVLEATLRKKKECNDRAMNIIERLIEPNVEAEWLLNNLKYINQCHFEDVVEERSIISCCGYPLCDKLLSNVPNKTYHISTKQNKVFDITDRKKYCSNICYKAGKFMKDQLYTSPLWLRDCEDLVEYHLYSPDNKSDISGVEVDFGVPNTLKEDSDVCSNSSVDEESKDEDRKGRLNGTVERTIEFHFDETIKLGIKYDEALSKITISENTSSILKETEMNSKSEGKHKSRKKVNTDPSSSGSTAKSSIQNVIADVEQKIRSWLTLETLGYLVGDERMEELLSEHKMLLKECDSKGKLMFRADPFIYERYADICKRLNIRELKESSSESIEPVNFVAKKPLPDYNQLKNENKEMEIKVKAFYKGDASVRFHEPELDDKEPDPILPPIDHHAAKATRRKIVMHKLNITLPDIQNALGLGKLNINKHVIDFVGLLNLKANNISFKPSEWTFIAIVILKLLTLKEKGLELAFEKESTRKYLQLILMSYNLDLPYLDRLVTWLTDFSYLLTRKLD